MVNWSNPFEVYISTLSENSQDKVRYSMGTFLSIVADGEDPHDFDWGSLSYPQCAAGVRMMEAEGYAASTISSTYVFLRRILSEGVKIGEIDAALYEKIASIKTPTVHNSGHGRVLTDAEVDQIFKACEGGQAEGLRDAVVVSLGLYAGLRRFEIAALRVEEIDFDAGILRVSHGKGNKSAEIPLATKLKRILRDWLLVRGNHPGYVVEDVRGDNIHTGGVGNGTINSIIDRVVERAGIEKFTPHDLRRTFVTRIIQNYDLSMAKTLARHASVETTTRYDRRGDDKIRNAVNDI